MASRQFVLKFLLMSPVQQAVLSSYANRNARSAGISQKSLRSIPISIPPYVEQVTIGDLLSALDDKIDLNRRMNETLEAMARAIFKDWFVDFSPTRAKMEGGAPYLAPEILALFPDRLDDDGKPEGWKNGTLGDIAVQAGESMSPEKLAPETPYIGLEHMPRRSIALENWEGAGKVTSGKLTFKRGDFLFGKLRPYFHKVGIAPTDGICLTDIVVLNAKAPKARSFVLSCISQDEFVAFTDRTSDGTKMPRTSWGRMEKYEISIPTPETFASFDHTVSPLFERIIANIHEFEDSCHYPRLPPPQADVRRNSREGCRECRGSSIMNATETWDICFGRDLSVNYAEQRGDDGEGTEK